MQLEFEYSQNLGSGGQPCAIHTPENIVQLIYVGENGSIYAKEAATPMGEWENREFGPSYMICDDIDAEHMKLKYVASSIFVVWKNATEEGEVVPYVAGVTHSQRHRFAVWMMHQDLSKYLNNGSIDFRLDDPVTSISITFENPDQVVSDENDTILTPGTSLTLFFRAGDSAKYILGRYFIDRNSMGVLEATTSVEGRNTIGKLLKDQTFDDVHNYSVQNVKTLLESILTTFGVTNYWVDDSADSRGFDFPPDMNGLEGLQEIIKTLSPWKIEEDLSGCIGIGDKNDDRFAQPSTYTFYRDKDVFSRNVDRDDADAYSRVCVHDQNRTVEVYKDVDFRFVMGKKKTLHVNVAEGTTLADATTYATEIASLLGSVGVVETFSGPFRPYLLTGDNAKIVGRTTKLLGIITAIRHTFGKNGYGTTFTVDSGSVANKTRLSDYITKITNKGTTSLATRLY